MKVLQVIHGYPMRYNAGSEVYTQGLAHALADRHQIHVFTRQENPYLPEYEVSLEKDSIDPRIPLHIVNLARARDRYQHREVDLRFRELIQSFDPDVIHVGHLNHLSTSLVLEAKKLNKPVVFTLHDYWLMCPRGQFIQMYPENPHDVWALCDGQEDRKCAVRCYARYFSGDLEDLDSDVSYWTRWVRRRMTRIRQVCDAVDIFIAPAMYLLRRFRNEFGIPERKLVYLDYGFHLNRLKGRRRVPGEPFTFGYIGTHRAAKGVNLLIEAFGRLAGEPLLRIWGRHQGAETEGLMAMVSNLSEDAASRIQWMGEYRNQDIVGEVFDRCDAIVAPSIWAENSPLVIHEALQARVPVITANNGGMAEYVGHEENGLLFDHRDTSSLADQMQRLVDDPGFGRRLGERGYLQSRDGNVPSMEEHVRTIEDIYMKALAARGNT